VLGALAFVDGPRARARDELRTIDAKDALEEVEDWLAPRAEGPARS
jgi:hypothetical protein